MKKFVLIMLSVGILAGCGSNDSEQAKTKFEGVKSENNYIAQGMDYLGQSDIVNAIKSFDMAIKEDPTNVNNYLVLGQVYLRLKQYDRAGDTFSGALRAAPDNGEVYYLLAMSRGLDGKNEQAITAVKRSVEIFMAEKNEVGFKKSVALLNGLTSAQEALAEAEAAKETLTEVTEDAAQTADNAKQTLDEALQNF